MPAQSMLDPIVRALVGVDPKHHGLILDIANKLGGPNADSYRKGIARALRDPLARFSLFRTIRIGTEKSVTALRDKLESSRREVRDEAKGLMESDEFLLAHGELELDLVIVTPEQLGFKDESAEYSELYTKARRLGLEVCPAEVGPQLRLLYANQPPEERLNVAMLPIRHGRHSMIFTLESYSKELWLGWNYCTDPRTGGTNHARYDEKFVFVLPRK